ncbi:MAG: hypothetical protein HOQ02_04640 [Lysobacter sp.]|nr:hypothetical protein [Lysobacter sp.]
MRERPILFSAPMVRALLDGRKTQTRRVVTELRGFGRTTEFGRSDTPGYDWHFRDKRACWNDVDDARLRQQFCPYGVAGDRLWVRETYFGNHFQHPNEPEGERELHYRADGLPDFEGEESLIRWRPSIHMPRWACRLVLEVTNVRVERLHALSEDDALAEGCSGAMAPTWYADRYGSLCGAQARYAFAALWASLNGEASWHANPCVWVIGFRRVTP